MRKTLGNWTNNESVHKICMQYEGRGAQKFVQLLRYKGDGVRILCTFPIESKFKFSLLGTMENFEKW